MRLVLVHGIENQGRSEAAIRDEWLYALSRSLPEPEMAKIRRAEIVVPYYGDLLYAETKAESAPGPDPVAQSVADAPAEEAAFYLDALEELASAAGVTEAQIRALAGAPAPQELGLPHNRRLLAVLRALESVSPQLGRLVIKLLPQVFVYLYRPHVTQAVDGIVRAALTKERCVIVGHSLGTVVTYRLLRSEPAALGASFFLTLGAPLAVKAVKNAIGPPFGRSSNIARWLNGLDPNDAVTIGRPLGPTAFGADIENIEDVDNGSEPHDVSMYLRDVRIGKAIADHVIAAVGIGSS
jgi:hypothetical protein